MKLPNRTLLLNHCIEQNYINDESTFDSFIESISEQFLQQLLNDLTYVMKPLVSSI